MNDEEANIDDKLVALFQKHLVYISFVFEKEECESRNGIITTFVLSIDKSWFLITAGHCIRDLESLISKGYKITQSRLIDSLGLEASHLDSIPFFYENALPFFLNPDDLDFDYGIIPLSVYYKKLLQKNNIKAFDETTWKLQPQKVDYYLLAGLPENLSAISSHQIELAPVLVKVEELKQIPDEYPKSEIPLFYGKVHLNEHVNTIRGMSGGPILGFYRNEIGELRYWLIALQSHWYPSDQNIVAYPTTPLGKSLEIALSEGNDKD